MKSAFKLNPAPELLDELKKSVARGEFRSLNEAIEVCVRYYLERHRENAWKNYLNEEIEAGLNESA